ncbi:hypothetical protein CASFOL_007935 [Castilleja foliolosa]|uniref:Maturase K n=1 Tax=Castilleja foliolosa TaxID=1961234 RepID=A0ABD3E328_9LAMI
MWEIKKMQGHLSAWLVKHGIIHRSLGFDYQGIETLQIKSEGWHSIAVTMEEFLLSEEDVLFLTFPKASSSLQGVYRNRIWYLDIISINDLADHKSKL